MSLKMCWGSKCPIKYRCLRHMTKRDPFNPWYFTHEPFNHERGLCPQFFPVDKDRDIREWVAELLEYNP